MQGQADTNDIEQLKNVVNGLQHGGKLENILNNQNEKTFYQSAMYKSPLDNFNDFYNQVFEKETASKQNNSKVEKSYFEYKTENVDLRIPHDTVVHVENGHGLQLNEWADFFNNISTPTDIAISNKPRYDGSPLLLKYNINGKTCGAVIEFFENKKPILTTVFSDTEKKVSDWIKENSHSQAKNTSSVTAKGMLLSNDYNSILSYFKNKLNPSEQTKILYQSANTEIKNDEKNLLMTHNAKSDNIDAILESGNLVAPSFAITKKDYEVDALSKFGDVTFIRKPEKIKFGSDNIYNRDIYSPRMPRPEYQLKDGTVIDSYEKEAQERLEKEKPEKYKERFDKPTSERFKDAKKVIFLGYTPSGNRRYKPYTAENIIAQMKKEGLLSGENFDYGLSSLMSRFATQQKSMEELKESAKDGLYSSEQLNEDYENLKKEYEELGDKVAPLYWDKWSFYEFQSDVFFAIAKNKKKYLKDTYNIEVPADLAKEIKDFVAKAQTMPRSYFEAKPLREVSLNEFRYVLSRTGTLTENQKNKLKNIYNIDVIEYVNNIKDALKQVETEQSEIYFQTGINQNENINIDNSNICRLYRRKQ